MSCITCPQDAGQVTDEVDKNPAILLHQITPDESYTTFERDDLTRGCEMWLRGRIFLKHSMPWCESVPKIQVSLPTLYRPIQVQLKIVTTAGEISNDKWIGFFISIEDICTLRGWKNSAYFDLTVRTALQKKHAKNVHYNPANNCWGWSKCFQLSAVTSCHASPLLIDIGFEHHVILPCLRLPFVFGEETTSEAESFNEAWGKVMVAEGKGNEATGQTDNDSSENIRNGTDDFKPKVKPRQMILDQETRRLHLDYFHIVSPRAANPTCLPQHPSMNTNSYEYRHSYGRNSRRKVRSAF